MKDQPLIMLKSVISLKFQVGSVYFTAKEDASSNRLGRNEANANDKI